MNELHDIIRRHRSYKGVVLIFGVRGKVLKFLSHQSMNLTVTVGIKINAV
jgi:hypothetical protein